MAIRINFLINEQKRQLTNEQEVVTRNGVEKKRIKKKKKNVSFIHISKLNDRI